MTRRLVRMLSRMRLSGLFLRTELDPSHDFSLDPRLVRMLSRMKHKAPTPFRDEDDWANYSNS